MKVFNRLVACSLIASTFLLGLPLQAQAAVVSTNEVISRSEVMTQRDKVLGFLAREDVRAALQDKGLSAEDARARVGAMSDSEIAQLAGRVDQAPAGGDILGLMFTVFVILLVTDILGFTKVFPFTRAVR